MSSTIVPLNGGDTIELLNLGTGGQNVITYADPSTSLPVRVTQMTFVRLGGL